MSGTVHSQPDAPAAAPEAASVAGQCETWQRATTRRALHHYVHALFWSDVAVITLAMVVAHLVRFGPADQDVTVFGAFSQVPLSYLPFSILGGLAWLLLLGAYHTYDESRLGSGTDEYKRVAGATLLYFGALAIGSYLLKVQFARGYFLIALPVGLLLLLIERWLWRRWLNRQRTFGRFKVPALIVGGADTATAIARELTRRGDTEFALVGACTANSVTGQTLGDTGVPVLGGLDDAKRLIAEHDIDTVIVTASRHMTPKRVRRLSWSLEPGRRHLVLAPSLVDVAGPRIHSRPVANLPLIHVETPRFDGRTLLIKRTFDIVASGLGLVILSPVFLIVGILIKAQDGGPVFFRQPRVGRDSKTFHMWKFRSMIVNAEEKLAELKASHSQQDAGNDVMFKLKDDPRVTKVGRFIRKSSIDELPQLINVFRGDMSLVGPRPPLTSEVQGYEARARRKFLVRPGITGLWQVSGRSDLSWDEAVRLDLYYVENWSFVGDLQILFRTVKAVVKSDGAY